MDLMLKGAVALVVGGSSGIGGAIVRMLADEGARVTAVARNADRLEAFAAEVSGSAADRITPLVGDATRPEDLDRAVTAAASDGRLDLAILAAGGSKRGRLEDLRDDEWMASYEWNLMSAVRLARASAPRLRQSRGSLTFLSAASAKQPTPGQLASNAAKAALVNLTRALAAELAPDVRVNAVCPGLVLTPQWQRKAAVEGPERGVSPEAYLEQVGQRTVLGRMGTPGEVAALVVVLASPRASYITGQAVSADGGLVRALI